MDWKTLISQLQESGLTQTEIAAKCGTSQGTIGDLAAGRSVEPRYGLGSALVALLGNTKQKEQRQAA